VGDPTDGSTPSVADEITLHGGGSAATILTPTGVEETFLAKQILLTNEFELITVAPGELAENQAEVAFLLTAKGRLNNGRGMEAMTLVFDPKMAIQLVKALRVKYSEIPIELR
jgi:hypothetical protein